MATAKLVPITVERAVFSGYKSIDYADVRLYEGLNVIIGDNGAGKSNFLQLLDWMFQPNRTRMEFLAGKLVLKQGNERVDWSLATSREAGQSNAVVTEKLSTGIVLRDPNPFNGGAGASMRNALYASSMLPPGWREQAVLLHRYVRFGVPESIPFLTYLDNIDFLLGGDKVIGTLWPDTDLLGLSDLLQAVVDNVLAAESAKALTTEVVLSGVRFPRKYIKALKGYSPIQDLRLASFAELINTPRKLLLSNLQLEFKVAGEWRRWNDLSDGTKRMFVLITEVAHFDSGLILIEEPELGVHPHQLMLIMDFLKEQSETKQIIVSTHSPQVLDAIDIDELDRIILAKYTPKKGTTLRHLTKAQQEKARTYFETTGYLSDYWVHSDLEK